MSGWDRKVLIGFALAVHDLIKHADEPSKAVDLMLGHGITPKDFANAGVCVKDMRVIRKAWRQRAKGAT